MQISSSIIFSLILFILCMDLTISQQVINQKKAQSESYQSEDSKINETNIVTVNEEIDPNGYVAFCPCMGRFGNQADQFLGALAFTKGLNRTLILPPWNEYIPYQTGSIQIAFDTYFKPEAINEYHKAITMEQFMDKYAPIIWPPEKRISFCYMERGQGKGCDAKDGNPFGPFWDNFKIDFVKSEIFGPELHYLVEYKGEGKTNWGEKYSGDKWPVLAFVGPPSGFPVDEQNAHLQKYLVWQDEIMQKTKSFISSLPKGPFIGIHLRNGPDWTRVCDLVHDSKQLFSSPQCLGYRNEHGKLTNEMCFPSTQTIIKQLKRAIKKIHATSVFVASDKNHLLSELSVSLKKLGVEVTKLDYQSPHVDLAILGQSNIFIGNCISSYSAFVKRERDVHGFPTEFWGFPPNMLEKNENQSYEGFHDEL